MTGDGAVTRDAGLTRRLAALAVDTALLGAGTALAVLLLWKSGVAGWLQPSPEAPAAAILATPGVLWATAALACLAVTAAWRAVGGTPGALLLGAVVVSRCGSRPGWGRGALRLGIALTLGGLGLLWCLGGRPALHDRLSGTRLVLEDEALERPGARASGRVVAP